MNNKIHLLIAMICIVTIGAGCQSGVSTNKSVDPAPMNNTDATTTATDLEFSVTEEQNELYNKYDAVDKQLATGYPVVFSTTTNNNVRYATFRNSGGDGEQQTYFFINSTKQESLKIDVLVFGGDFGASGNLNLSLNNGRTIVIQRDQNVNATKGEITYTGLRTDGALSLTFKNPLIYKPTSALRYSVLGVSPDLKYVYFSDNQMKFYYDFTNNSLHEITQLPASLAEPKKK